MNNFKNSVTSLFVLILFAACASQPVPELAQVESHPDLAAHSREFKQEVIRVTDGVYVAVGYGLANSILLVGDDGVVIVDTLESAEAAAPVKKAFDDISSKPVKAIIYTHSHADHFGGVRGLVTDEQVASGEVKIIAPAGFMEFAIAENVLAGNAMSRRASYQFGNVVPPGPQGQVGAGLGKTTSSGAIGLIPPTEIIRETGREMTNSVDRDR